MVAIKTLLDVLTIVAAVLCLAPVAPFLDWPIQLLAALAVLGGICCDRRGRYPLPPLPATLLALAGVAYYAARISRADVAAPVVHALVVLLAVRLLTVKQARDYLQIFVLALFLLAGSSLLSLEISFIFYLVLLVFAVTVSLVLLTVFVTDPRLALPHRDFWWLIRVALIMPAASLVLMLVFFVILPRTGQPLWNFLTPAQKVVSGLTDSLNPGAYARLAATKALAFRAEGPELPPEDRYWRALVLNRPQGNRWVREEPPGEGVTRPERGRSVTLDIYPEPRADRYLVTLDRPQQISGLRYQFSPDQVFRTPATRQQRFRYTVEAVSGADLRVTGRIDREFYLTVPERISPRLAAAAAQIAASGETPAARLAALAGFFRERGLIYARDDLPGGPDPVDAFLFEKRRGYCEFFAAAYVTLARLAGVPARLVGGYYGGEYNALGGYYLVTDDNAHIWVEVLASDNLWQRIDPSQWASNAGSALGPGHTAGLDSWQRLADTLNYHWIQLVVIFDLSRQVTLWRETRSALHGWRLPALEPAFILLASGLLSLGGAGLLIVRQRRLSREARLLAALRARARRRLGGEVPLENLGLTELAERLDSQPCREFARIYQGAVFRDRPLTAAEVARLQELLKTI
jgi:transglutaminase-like putative cysteine protease